MSSEGHYLYCHYKKFVVGGLSRSREPRRRHRYGQPPGCVGSVFQSGTQQLLFHSCAAPSVHLPISRSEPCRMAEDKHEYASTETGKDTCWPLSAVGIE